MIFETTPAPTVLPPSLIANLIPFSIAIGCISCAVIFIRSPGIMTISRSADGSIGIQTGENPVAEPPPTVDFDFDYQSETQVEFMPRVNRSYSEIRWSFGDGQTSGENRPVHQFAADPLN